MTFLSRRVAPRIRSNAPVFHSTTSRPALLSVGTLAHRHGWPRPSCPYAGDHCRSSVFLVRQYDSCCFRFLIVRGRRAVDQERGLHRIGGDQALSASPKCKEPPHQESMARPFLLTTILLLLVPASPTQSQPVRCPTTVADTIGWPVYDEGGFSLRIPPRFERLDVLNIDSQIGEWEAKNATIVYDLGRYSTPLKPNEDRSFPELTVCQEGKGPHTPRIVVYRHEYTGGVRVGAHWAEFPKGFASSTALTIVGEVPSKKGRAEMLAVIQSVRFTPEKE